MFNVTLFTKEIKPVEIGKTVAKVLLVVAQLLLVVGTTLTPIICYSVYSDLIATH